LERNLFNVRYDRPFPLLDLTLGGVYGYPYNRNPAEGGTFQGPASRGKFHFGRRDYGAGGDEV
jgi:hypothetical protein